MAEAVVLLRRPTLAVALHGLVGGGLACAGTLIFVGSLVARGSSTSGA